MEETMIKHNKSILTIASAVALFVMTSTADAAWYRYDGVLISNVCRAPSGAFWIYPLYQAQPVGNVCRIPTGEFGAVTVD